MNYYLISALVFLGYILETLSAPTRVDRSASVKRLQSGLPWANRAWGKGKSSDSTKNVKVVDVDGFDISSSDIENYHAKGMQVLCYISVGTVESWRSDVKDNKDDWDEIKGKNMDEWSGETWIDIVHKLSETKKLMRKRFEMCADKGCDSIEADNVDCYQTDCISGTSKSEKKKAQISYGKWQTQTAHGLGMSIGLKNSLDLIKDFINDYDYAMNEQCVEYGECHFLEPFHKANKAVFGTEYGEKDTEIKSEAKRYGVMSKNEKGGEWVNMWSSSDYDDDDEEEYKYERYEEKEEKKTSTSTAKPTPTKSIKTDDEDCLLPEGYEYGGSHIESFYDTPTPEDCRAKCKNVSQCTHFNINVERERCYLKYNSGEPKVNEREGYTGGPRNC
eukprot:Awhi_evm1s6905